jgi:predicted ester cyclase
MSQQTVPERNIQVARDYTREVFNGHQPERAGEFWTPDGIWHGGTLGTVEGIDNIVGLLKGFIGALPDLEAVEQEIGADGDTVWVRFQVHATHQGDLVGIPPTGRTVKWDAVDVYHLTDGKISEEWAVDDLLAILQNIGYVSVPWVS